MKTVIIVKTDKDNLDNRISDRAWKKTKENYTDSKKEYLKLVDRLEGKTIEITRINQALEVYSYSCSQKDSPPAYWCSTLVMLNDEEAFLKFDSCYKNEDTWKIVV